MGESVRILANDSVAMTDGAQAGIFVVRPDGTPDTTLGANNSGVLTLNPLFVPEVRLHSVTWSGLAPACCGRAGPK